MNLKESFKNRKFRIVIALIAVGGIAAWCLRGCESESENVEELFTEVQEGPLVINIEESGEIVPSDKITLKNEVQGRVSIISLIPEGTIVKEGDVLVQLDVSAKVDEKDSQEITLRNAESALEVAREELEIQKNQSASDVELAEQDYEFAKEDLAKYEEGEYPTKLMSQKGQLALKEQQVKQAKDKFEWSQKLYAEKFISETELESDELNLKSNQLTFETAQRELELLETYTHRRELAKYTSDVKQKGMALERTKKRAASAIAKQESNLRARESEYMKQRQRYDKLTNQIDKAIIRAPRGGQVVYADNGWRQEPLRAGSEVYERQNLIELPTADGFSAKFNLREANVKNVVTGMTVRVRCDAIPGKVFSGTVSSVAPMPDKERGWMNADIKEYPSLALIPDGKGELRNGMGCKVEVVVEQYDSAVYVPVQCVVRSAGKAYVYVKAIGGSERRAVETGMANSRFVRILSGVRKGERVSLSPPLAGSATDTDVKLAKKGDEAK